MKKLFSKLMHHLGYVAWDQVPQGSASWAQGKPVFVDLIFPGDNVVRGWVDTAEQPRFGK